MNGLTLPWLPPVMGPGNTAAPAVVYFDDFVASDGYAANGSDGIASETANVAQFHLTLVDGATDAGETIVISDAEPGGVLAITTNDADDDSMNLQLNGEAFQVNADRDLYFATRLKVNDADTVDWFVGLANTATDVLGSAVDLIGFGSSNGSGAMENAASANIFAWLEGTGMAADSDTDTASDLADDTFVELSFHLRGASVAEFFVNGNKAVTNSNSDVMLAAGDDLTLTIAMANQSSAASTMEIDYILVAQERG
jgi:hypothetical protein